MRVELPETTEWTTHMYWDDGLYEMHTNGRLVALARDVREVEEDGDLDE